MSRLIRDLVIAVLAVVVIVGVVIATPPIFFFNVTVSGTASTGSEGAPAANVTFVDEKGVPYVATVTGGTYSITLMNGDTYSLYVVYESGGNCTAGSLNLNTLGWTQKVNATC